MFSFQVTKESILQCQICYETYNLKSRLPTIVCGNRHIICQSCIKSGGLKLQYNAGAPTGNYNCPICNQFIPRWKQFSQCNLTVDFITVVQQIQKQYEKKANELKIVHKKTNKQLLEKIDVLNQCNTFLKSQNFNLSEQVANQQDLKSKANLKLIILRCKLLQAQKIFNSGNVQKLQSFFKELQSSDILTQTQNFNNCHKENIQKKKKQLLTQRNFRVHVNNKENWQQATMKKWSQSHVLLPKISKNNDNEQFIQDENQESFIDLKQKGKFKKANKLQNIGEINVCRFISFNSPNIIQNRCNEPYKIMGKFPLKFDENHQFSIKVLKTQAANIYFGVATDQLLQKFNNKIQSEQNLSSNFTGLCLANCLLIKNLILNSYTSQKTYISMKIDLNKNKPTLQIVGQKIRINNLSSQTLLYPVLIMMDNGDKIQIVSKIF